MPGDPDSSFWNNKTVLITGSAGFAGSHLARYLRNLGANVRCFVRKGEEPPINGPDVTSAIGDVEDYPSLLRAFENIDVGFHLAAITAISEARANIMKTFNTNTLGTLNFLMAGVDKKAGKLVYVSTCQVYGKQNHYPITESAAPHPIDIYSASKLAGENLAISFSESSKLDVTISRAFNHYGPGQRSDFLIPEVIMKLVKGEEIELRNPKSTRDFSHVDDIVRGYVLLAERGRSGEIYHLASGIERSVRDVVDTVAGIGNFKAKISSPADAHTVEVSRSVGDYSKAKRELGWTPRIDFEEGIRTTIKSYRTNT